MTTLNEALETFNLSNIAEGKAAKTVSSYDDRIKQFIKVLGGDTPISKIATNDIRQYLADRRQTLAKATVDSDIRSLHRFFKWSAEEYDIPNPMKNIRRPKPAQAKVKAINPADFIKMLEATTDDDMGIRDRALLSFLADTGARRGGAEGLQKSDVDLVRRRALVTEKGMKQREVRFSYYTSRLLNQWFLAHPGGTEYVFVSLRDSNKVEALTGSGIYQICKRIGRKAGVERYNPHAFRHNFARLFIQDGGDISVLAKLLGNSIEVAAAYYAVFSPDELSELQDQHSPLRQMLKNTDERL